MSIFKLKINFEEEGKEALELPIAAGEDVLDVVLDNGIERKTFCLNRSYQGLYLPPNTWRYMDNFSTNSVSLHICSTRFDESDYIRDFEEFKKNKHE